MDDSNANDTPPPTSVDPEPQDTPVSGSPPTEQTAAAVRPAAENPPDYGAGMPLDSGTITVSETVVAKVAAMAAREVAGVHSLGVGAARQVTSVRERIPGAAPSTPTGVTVEVGRTQAAVDLDLVVEYGTPITQIAREVRARVISVVEEYTGLQVVEVNITVDDVNLPALTDSREGRLQ